MSFNASWPVGVYTDYRTTDFVHHLPTWYWINPNRLTPIYDNSKSFLVKWQKSLQISQTKYVSADFCGEQIKGKGLCVSACLLLWSKKKSPFNYHNWSKSGMLISKERQFLQSISAQPWKYLKWQTGVAQQSAKSGLVCKSNHIFLFEGTCK